MTGSCSSTTTAQTSEQGNLGAGQADAAGTPDAAGSVGGVGDVGVGQHAGGFQPGSHVGVDGDGVNGVGALTQQVFRSSDGGRGQGVADLDVAGALRHVADVRLVQRCAVSRNQTPHLGDQLLVHLPAHVLSQLATGCWPERPHRFGRCGGRQQRTSHHGW